MAESGETHNPAESRSLLRSLPTILAGTLASLAVIVYPLGLVAYWIQMWRDYTHDATVALYAASLAPAPVVADRSLDLLLTTIVVAFLSPSASLLFQMPIDEAKIEARPTALRVLTRLVLSRAFRFFFAVLSVGTTGLLFAIVEPPIIPLNGTSDMLLYWCAVVVAGGGGLLASEMMGKIFRTLAARNTDATENHEGAANREFFGTSVRAGATLILGAVVAAVILIPVQSPSLASITFTGSVDYEAKLIGHSQGYWYVIKNGERDVTAIPDSTAGTVNISGP